MSVDPNNPMPDPSSVSPEPEGSRWWRAHHMLLGFVAIGLVAWFCSGFYVVGANEVAVVERLGEVISVSGSGPHFGFPWPVDKVRKIPISRKLTLTVTEFNNVADQAVEDFKNDLLRDPANRLNPQQLNAVFNSYLVTGDKNMLHASVVINYQIDDARQYLLAAAGSRILNPEDVDPEAALAPILSRATERVLNRVFGTMHVDDALTERRDELVRGLTAGLQDECKLMNLGVYVLSTTVSVTWPPAVDAAFSRVPAAKQEKQQRIERAGSESATKIAEAQGNASRLLAEANGYKQNVVDAAQGEKARFDVIRINYEHAGIITTQSLFADAMTTILKNVGQTMIVAPGQKVQVFLQAPEKTPAGGQPGNLPGNRQ